MTRYNEYRDSGVKWIGEIPRHWEMKRLALKFQENKRQNNNLSVTEAYKFNYGTLVRKDEGIDINELKDTYAKYTILSPNDIVINCLNLNYDFVTQRVAIAENIGIITSAYLTIVPRKNVSAKYYLYLFKAMDAMKLFHGMGTGIRLTLSFAEIKKQFIPIPPYHEQQAIADYLQEKTQKIDKYIAERQQEITLFEQLKQAEIANVVTKGLNPNVPLKVEYRTIRLSKICSAINGLWVGEKKPLINVGVIRNANFTKNFKLDYSKIAYIDVEERSFEKRKLLKGDLIVEKSGGGDKAPVGRVVYYDGPDGLYSFSNFTMVLRINDKTSVSAKYLFYYLMGLYIQGYMNILQFNTTGLHNLIIDKFLSIQVPIPPYQEQQAVVDYIDNRLAKIDQHIAELTAEIEYLKEFKQRLISDAVTGQIKVVV